MITFSPIQKNIQETLSKKMRMMDKEPPFEINEPSTEEGGEPQPNYMFARSVFIRMTSLLTKNKKPIILMGGELVHRHPHILNDDVRYGLDVYGHKSGGIDEVNPNLRPMAGIQDVNVEYAGGGMTFGATRHTAVTWKCWTWEELEKFKPFFLKHGRDVLIEFGWGFDGPDKPTLLPIINEDGTINEGLIRGTDTLDPLQTAIPSHILAQNGHYDAVLGTINNFEFTVNETGGFDCTTNLVSKGVSTLGKMDSLDMVQGAIKDLPILRPDADDKDGSLWWKKDNFLKAQADMQGKKGLTPYYSFRAYMGTLEGHLNLNAKNSKGSIAYLLGDGNPYCTWGWFEDNVLSRFAGQVNNSNDTIVGEVRSIENIYLESGAIAGSQPTRIKTSPDLMPIDYSPKGWFWVNPQAVPPGIELEDVRIDETNSQLISGLGVASGAGVQGGTGMIETDAAKAGQLISNNRYKIGDFKLMFGPSYVQDNNDTTNGSFQGIYKYSNDKKWVNSFLVSGIQKNADDNAYLDATMKAKKEYRDSQKDSYFRVFTADDKDYGILRNIYFGHEFLSECFEDGTIKEGVESVWSKFSLAYGGIYDIGIEFDDKEGRLMLKDKGFAQKRVSEVLKNTSKKHETEKYQHDGVFVFPIWEKTSIVKSQNLSAKIPSAQQMVAMYGSSNTGTSGDGLTRDMKDWSARALAKTEKVHEQGLEKEKQWKLYNELAGDMEQPFRKGYTFGRADANSNEDLQWRSGTSPETTNVYEDSTGGTIKDGTPSLFIDNDLNDTFGKGINEWLKPELEAEFNARLLRVTGLENEDEIKEAGLGDEVITTGSLYFRKKVGVKTTEDKMREAKKTFQRATTKVDAVLGLYVNTDDPYVSRHADQGLLQTWPKMKVEYKAVMLSVLKGPKGVQGKTDPLVQIDLEIDIDGTGGIFPGNSFHSSYLPQSYMERMCFQVMGASHKIDTSGWTTTIKGQMRAAGDSKPDRPPRTRVSKPIDGTLDPERKKEIEEDPSTEVRVLQADPEVFEGGIIEVEAPIAVSTRPIKQPPILPPLDDDDKNAKKIFVNLKEEDIKEYEQGLTQIGHITEFDVSRGHPTLKTTTVDDIFKVIGDDSSTLYKPGPSGDGVSAKGVPLSESEASWTDSVINWWNSD